MAETWTVLRILEWTADYFRQQGIESGRLDAELLLASLLELDRVGLYLQFDRPLNQREQAGYRELVKRRAAHEPVAYIVGETEFWSLPIRVSPAVLIPRSDTEVLVEEALECLEDNSRVLDIGLGSGAIAIALAHENKNVRVRGIDISPEAVEIARANSRLNQVDGRVDFSIGNLEDFSGGPYDLIVSNPPYIPHRDLDGLMPDVREFEPLGALDGGTDGLDAYRAILRQAPQELTDGGRLLVEIGINQADPVRQLFAEAGLQEITLRDDYAGIPRVVSGMKK
ncbi:MAG: peptide chain release factor N(5)-glutamine methyltransferase [Desulfuromonas sp.]|nr:MAG: peptide chain release factor N(5)-glutamine methyltransferase [Desulfuromonas sp.]